VCFTDAGVYLVCYCCDLDLGPMTLIYKLDLHILKTYLSTEMKFVGQWYQTFEHEQNRQTQRQTDLTKHITILFRGWSWLITWIAVRQWDLVEDSCSAGAVLKWEWVTLKLKLCQHNKHTSHAIIILNWFTMNYVLTLSVPHFSDCGKHRSMKAFSAILV